MYRISGGDNWIFEIDSSGNITWEWKADEDHAIVDLQRGLNGEWYYSADFVITLGPGSFRKTPRLIARDSTFNLLWQNEFGSPTDFGNRFPEVAVTPDNDVVATGQIFQEKNHPETGYLGWVTRVSNAGEKEWTVIDTSYAELGSRSDYLNGVAIAPSGTIYAAGKTQEYIAPGRLCGWILKVSPDGCVDTLCFTTGTGELEEPGQQVHVYPNPFGSTIKLELPAGVHGSILEVSDLSGRVLYTKDVDTPTSPINVDLSALPSGLLIYTLRDDKGGVHTGTVVKVE